MATTLLTVKNWKHLPCLLGLLKSDHEIHGHLFCIAKKQKRIVRGKERVWYSSEPRAEAAPDRTELIQYAETAQEVWAIISEFYLERPQPKLPRGQ